MLASQFRRRCARDVPYDDLISEATYALVRAAMSFDPGRGVPFSAFATNGIKMYLIQFTRAWRNRYRFWHAISQCAEKDVGEITGHSSHKNRDVCDEVGDREACDQIRKRLPAQWWGVLSDYMQGDNQEEIALKRGVCRQRGHQLLKKAREMAFKSFEELAAVYCA
jgi:DNA-directed RNA polymerase specialized sigma subunit